MIMYNEILQLEKFCKEIGVECKLEKLWEGHAIRFNNGGDAVQHDGSYGSKCGCVEFGYTGFEEVDFCATKLDKAKEFVIEHKDKLNGVEK